MRARLCVLVSGRGRNLRALHAACADGRIDADLVRVVSNRPDAAAVSFAREQGIEAVVVDNREFGTRMAFDAALGDAIAAADPDWIALAGFMRVLSDGLVQRFAGRMLNVHPSLLPRHRGLHTHRAVMAAGEREHGASVHFVSPELDSGPVIIQGRCSVTADDDEDTLAQRVLETVGLRIYPQAVAWACAGRLRWRGRSAVLDDRALTRPLDLTSLEEGF